MHPEIYICVLLVYISVSEETQQVLIMRVFILAYLVAAATALAPLHVAKERIPGKYIVTLKVSQMYIHIHF